MSVDFFSIDRWVMEWDDIKTVVPEEAAGFEQQLQVAGMDMEEFCLDWYQNFEGTDWEEVAAPVQDAWDELAEAFTKATTVEGVGLELEPQYHDLNYEESVAFFVVRGTHSRQWTGAGAKYKDKIKHKKFIGVG